METSYITENAEEWIAPSANLKIMLLNPVDVYQQMYVLWTKYCTELDSLDPLQ